jgi:hypothetical protein
MPRGEDDTSTVLKGPNEPQPGRRTRKPPDRVRWAVEARVKVQMALTPTGDAAEADRCLDAMERATGLHGEPNAEGRLYVVEGEDVGQVADRIAAHLPKGWQDHLIFEL